MLTVGVQGPGKVMTLFVDDLWWRLMDPERTRVIHRDLNRTYQTLVRGEGVYLYDDEGNRYIDASGGSAAVTAIGHGVPEVVNARSPTKPRAWPTRRHTPSQARPSRAAPDHHRGVRPRRDSARSGSCPAARRRPTTR